MAFDEKAGRSQVDSLPFSLGKVPKIVPDVFEEFHCDPRDGYGCPPIEWHCSAPARRGSELGKCHVAGGLLRRGRYGIAQGLTSMDRDGAITQVSTRRALSHNALALAFGEQAAHRVRKSLEEEELLVR